MKYKMIDDRYGKLVVVEEVPKRKGKRFFLCQCDCGNTKIVNYQSLRNGLTTSCGCFHREMISTLFSKHGGSGTRTYTTWKSMRDRCNNPNSTVYEFYGGRGISYDSRWQVYENFLEDMGPRPEGMTLDRIDVNGHYTKENCRWATNEEQGLNKRAQARSVTGVSGVIPARNNTFVATFKSRHLGTFDLLEKAILARQAAEEIWKAGDWPDNIDNASLRDIIKVCVEEKKYVKDE